MPFFKNNPKNFGLELFLIYLHTHTYNTQLQTYTIQDKENFNLLKPPPQFWHQFCSRIFSFDDQKENSIFEYIYV